MVQGAPVPNENTPHRKGCPASLAWFHPTISQAKNTAYDKGILHKGKSIKSSYFMALSCRILWYYPKVFTK
jgi:hypothetical protein